MAQPCPPWTHVIAENGSTAARSASSSTTLADFPPSSRKTFLTVTAARSITRRPVAVEPVKVTRSTRGSVESISPSRWSEEATMLTTPGGISVRSATIRPTCVADHGVVLGAVGAAPEHLAGGRVEVLEDRAVARGDEPAVDQVAGLRGEGCERHGSSSEGGCRKHPHRARAATQATTFTLCAQCKS